MDNRVLCISDLRRCLECTKLKWKTSDNGRKIGFTVGQGVWHWFESIGSSIAFDHAYSMNTGKSKSGRSQRKKSIYSLKCRGINTDDIL